MNKKNKLEEHCAFKWIYLASFTLYQISNKRNNLSKYNELYLIIKGVLIF